MRGNKFYAEVSAATNRAGLDFSLDCIIDLNNNLHQILFGSWEAVHAAGAELSRRLCGVRYERKADAALVGGYPYLEALQLMKPLSLGAMVVKPGGTIILTAPSNSDFPPFFHEVVRKAHEESGGLLAKYAVDAFKSGRLLLEGGAPVDLNCALFLRPGLSGRVPLRPGDPGHGPGPAGGDRFRGLPGSATGGRGRGGPYPPKPG